MGRKRVAMQEEITFAVRPSTEGGYEARALGHSIFTDADDWQQLKEMLRDAVRCHFDEAEVPRVIRMHPDQDEIIQV